MKLKHTIEKVVNYAVHVTEPENIIIFGSMVNGTANVFSDIDLLIISETSMNKKEAIKRIKSFSEQLSVKTDILIYSKSELEAEIKTPHSFVSAIYNAGQIIYEKNRK